MGEQSERATETVVVEAGLGPTFGYYHTVEAGAIGGEEMDRDEAEAEGYSPCSSCFGDDGDD